MEIYTNIILTLLTMITGVLTIVNFANGKNKSSNEDGKQIGKIEQKLCDIDVRTETIEREVKDLSKSFSRSNELSIEARESARQAHKRVDGLERRLGS